MWHKGESPKKDRWIGFRLGENDEDLRSWWDSIPEGERSEALKAAARMYIAGHAIEDPTARELTRLRLIVEGLARKIEQGVIVRANGGNQEEIDESQAAERERKIRARGW